MGFKIYNQSYWDRRIINNNNEVETLFWIPINSSILCDYPNMWDHPNII